MVSRVSIRFVVLLIVTIALMYSPGAHEYHVDYGLNWKSLTQPAILPINTDYMPNVAALVKGYDVQNFYQLLIDKHECPFPNPECLMQEMIASRVTRVSKTNL